MKVYVLVKKDKDGKPTFNMPTHFGRLTRAYSSKARAKIYAKKFECNVIELELEQGKIV